MDVQVGDRVQPAPGSAQPVDPRSPVQDGRGAHGELRLQIGWRWIPDPDDTNAPTPAIEDAGGRRAALLRALAWASLR